MKLAVEVELGNEAMQSAWQVGQAIKHALFKQAATMSLPLQQHEVGTVRDENGNTVGKWEVVQ